MTLPGLTLLLGTASVTLGLLLGAPLSVMLGVLAITFALYLGRRP